MTGVLSESLAQRLPDMIDLFINAFIALLVIANPLGVMGVFVGLMAQASQREIRATAIKAVSVAFGLLLFFAFLGEPLLAKLGISISSFRVAGGLLLFVIAFRMLFGENRPEAIPHDSKTYVDRSDVAVFPLAIPLIAGPGCMTLTILLMSNAKNGMEDLVIVGAMAIVMIVTLACLLAARFLQKIIGISGTSIIARVMGMILAARSVQFIVDGLHGLNFPIG